MKPSRVQPPHEFVDDRYVKPSRAHADNSVWTPQYAVHMHRPEQWGVVDLLGDR